MPDENGAQPADDVQKALDTANQLASGAHNHAKSVLPDNASDTLTHAGHCPLLGLRYALARCGFMVEKNPWQALAALSIAIGCGWVCWYFGLTVFACLILYAIYAED